LLVGFHRAAQVELEEAVAFYGGRSPVIGRAFRDEVSDAVDRLMAHPSIGLEVRSSLRRYVLKRFPYSLIYRPTADQILILAVMHHKRKPEYWRDRL
jgi:plasmid stabilization system protein ParE